MGTIHFFESMRGFCVGTKRLDVVIFLFGKFVSWNVEIERAAERDIEKLHPFTNGKKRQTTRERLIDCRKLPMIPHWIDILLKDARIGNRLLQKFRRNVRTAGQKKTVNVREIDFAVARIADFDLGMFREKWLKPFFILLAEPGGKFRHDVDLTIPSIPERI